VLSSCVVLKDRGKSQRQEQLLYRERPEMLHEAHTVTLNVSSKSTLPEHNISTTEIPDTTWPPSLLGALYMLCICFFSFLFFFFYLTNFYCSVYEIDRVFYQLTDAVHSL